ncbi:AAA family ATPase [Mucilaginibacter sp. UR6-1]|uniref:HRDC domain-containing protein n=1 Tax=Mucilaginibacter sp. UR6-1 TaxID=1435643 RepID=UPI001E53133F|nr:HRDC domain-containing protein [Mucilaginibacter sp. UR6-1]MCC8408192.1 AAA family ATPase [Mucilaginibacter sp. UR6-1]
MNNPLLELAQAYTDNTNTIVFLTGKAGTGKTTFLRQLKQHSQKRMVIVAPTGVAAINAGGMTIHSLFQLPFGPLLPGNEGPELHYNPEKRELLQNLELLVIDEISMVRPDVLDQLDAILRSLRGNTHAFGGVQLLLIGDLAQLSPIIRDEEWALLRPYYATPYFFSSQVMQRSAYVRIELETVYRQSDPVFVAILNGMRDQSLTPEQLAQLNERYVPNFVPARDEAFITLTTHNKIAQQINSERLDALSEEAMEYKATIRGEFPADAYPTEISLQLKVGAQVMFVKNDSSAEKRYYNGKIGTVVNLEADTVHVLTPEGLKIAVQALEWSNVKYQMDGEQVAESNAGSFAQVPLRLAWAITIHKSQGLTFEQAVIDVSGAFAHGQAYVALSRCRSLQGLVLRHPVSNQNIIGDPQVRRFNQEAVKHRPDQAMLHQHQTAYRNYLLSELFNLSALQEFSNKLESLLPDLEKDILSVAIKMQAHLATYTDDRVQKAADYFHNKLEGIINALHSQLGSFIGNSKELAGRADKLLRWLISRISFLDTFRKAPFNTQAFLELRRKPQPALSHSYLKTLNAKPNEELLDSLLAWRNQTAKAEGVLASMLFSEQALAAVAAKLPGTLKSLSGIKGIGSEKTKRYGAAILTLIRAFEHQNSGIADQASLF